MHSVGLAPAKGGESVEGRPFHRRRTERTRGRAGRRERGQAGPPALTGTVSRSANFLAIWGSFARRFTTSTRLGPLKPVTVERGHVPPLAQIKIRLRPPAFGVRTNLGDLFLRAPLAVPRAWLVKAQSSVLCPLLPLTPGLGWAPPWGSVIPVILLFQCPALLGTGASTPPLAPQALPLSFLRHSGPLAPSLCEALLRS